MKHYLLLLGGFIGFAVTFTTGLVAQADIDQILFNSAIGCIVVGLLFKWISNLLVESIAIQRKKTAIAAGYVAEQPPKISIPITPQPKASKK